MQEQDLHLYSPTSLLAQSQQAEFTLGYYTVYFYVDEQGLLAKVPTSKTALFYFSPSGGTLRDENLNIVTYSARLDKFKGIGKVE